MDFSHYAEVSPNELETDADKSTMSG